MQSRRFGAVAVVVALALVAACAARSSGNKVTCAKPEIIGVHWMFVPQVDSWILRMELAVNGHGSSGRIWITDEYDPEGFDYTSKSGVQTGNVGPLNQWGDDDKKEVSIIAESDCGLTTKIDVDVTSPKTGYLGSQKYFPCADYIIVDSRGSGEAKGTISPPGALFGSKFRNLHPGGTVRFIDNPYPAAGSKASMLTALVKSPHSAYYQSVVEGKYWLLGKMLELEDNCPSSAVLLTGYSQGAQISADGAQHHFWPTLIGVVLFGDPYFNPRDDGDRGGFSKWRFGTLGIREADFLEPTMFRSYCHEHDPVCQGFDLFPAYRFSEHNNYAALGEPQEAAKYFTKVWG